MEDIKEEEPEVISFKELMERHPDTKAEELFIIVLVCKNCGYKDLLQKFAKKKEDNWEEIHKPSLQPRIYPVRPSPYPYRFKPRYIQSNSGMMKAISNSNMIMEFEELFYCPKCGSSLVVLCKEFIKNNLAKVL